MVFRVSSYSSEQAFSLEALRVLERGGLGLCKADRHRMQARKHLSSTPRSSNVNLYNPCISALTIDFAPETASGR